MNGTQKDSTDETAYIYIITRRDLPITQQAVQSGHAIWEASQAFSQLQTEHPHFCLCAVKDEKRLRHDLDKLVKAGIRITAWYEPDFENNPLTAFATEPISGERRHLFRNFQLLKAGEPVCRAPKENR